MIRTSHLPRLIFLQGPPSSGKDTIADLLNAFAAYRHHKFAQPIIDAMESQFPTYFTPSGRPRRSITDFKRHDFGPHLSDDDRTVTGRDIMIAWSEQFMKPLFGATIFGRLAVQRIHAADAAADTPDFRVVMSDSGFEPESHDLLSEVGTDNATIIQIYRPGKTFEGDSRSYWTNPSIATFSYNNAIESLDAMQLDFVKWFNETVYSYADQSTLRSPANA